MSILRSEIPIVVIYHYIGIYEYTTHYRSVASVVAAFLDCAIYNRWGFLGANYLGSALWANLVHNIIIECNKKNESFDLVKLWNNE